MSRLAVNGAAPVWSAAWPKWPIYGERELVLLREVLESGHWAYDGPVEARFQEAFCALHTVQHGLTVANGTIALQLALEALDIGYGDEVIVPANTWQATAVRTRTMNCLPVLQAASQLKPQGARRSRGRLPLVASNSNATASRAKVSPSRMAPAEPSRNTARSWYL